MEESSSPDRPESDVGCRGYCSRTWQSWPLESGKQATSHRTDSPQSAGTVISAWARTPNLPPPAGSADLLHTTVHQDCCLVPGVGGQGRSGMLFTMIPELRAIGAMGQHNLQVESFDLVSTKLPVSRRPVIKHERSPSLHTVRCRPRRIGHCCPFERTTSRPNRKRSHGSNVAGDVAPESGK